eukprot:c20906_g1_i1 orf=373-684(+)
MAQRGCTECVTVETTEVKTRVKPNPKQEIKQHARKEHLAGAGALLSTAVAMYEKHKAKTDPENAHKHHVAGTVAGAMAIGSGAYALHERHDKKDAEKTAKYNC